MNKLGKRLRIADIKGGPEEGLVRHWVRTASDAESYDQVNAVRDILFLRLFLAVLSKRPARYSALDKAATVGVENGLISTGASVWIEGTIGSSQGSKQKIELNVQKLVVIPNSNEGGESPVNAIPTTEAGSVDWSQDFFGKRAYLTVSGQLNDETYAALSDMIEPELAFADLDDDMACATAYLQYVVKYVLENCKEYMDFFNTWIEKWIINRLSDVVEKNSVQMTYTDAVELLLKAKKKFDFPVKWGCDLQSEHERYITEEAFGGCPVIIRDYPKDIKAFYMRQNDDGKTIAAMDMLVPRVGELIGGSQRERLEYLEELPHAGFGLGFERLVQFATGIDNIRDAVPFPRTPGSAEF
ncbi:hypothetical protein RND71_030002 [Anisodus tanguticus]|uniref:Aminoacyl-tRNA synthetase class II (D/K/N) domain-containing protein n=1 Tax=Anisodus tanguticus TaxID=243964 RepID=A0AAE1RGB9_9SOLA|nr:hypothetical protein RND71_030002 [Anisodus tanguticus]